MKKVIECLKNFPTCAINGIYKFSASFNKFRRASFLSLIILAVIFLLVQALDQAYTLLIDMIEGGPFSLILCYIIISVFALVISHYPIYIYYAKDINDSKDENYWYIHRWLRVYNVFVYKTKPLKLNPNAKKKEYKQDYMAKYLRYTLGLFIFCIWHYYIHETFKPKLLYAETSKAIIIILKILCYIVPFILMGIMLEKKRLIDKENKAYKKTNATTDSTDAYKKFNKSGELFFLTILTVSVLLLLGISFFGQFNCTTYFLLQLLTFFLSVTYIYFRLFRSKIYDSSAAPIIKYISIDFNYILFFFIVALGVVALLIQSNLAVAFGWTYIINAMPILLAYIYLIYYTLACILKYLFVMQAIKRQSDAYNDGKINVKEYYDTLGYSSDGILKIISLESQEGVVRRSKKVVAYSITLVILFISLTFMFSEREVHQLDTDASHIVRKDSLHINDYKAVLKNKVANNKPLFFVASHGGALKANIWTMKVLNEIQKETNGAFLQQTASFSGASGGMMGLSMYSVLAGKYKNEYDKITDRINTVALTDFASMDISYTLGWDFIRKVYPLNAYAAPHKDRAYYSMVAYQNILESKDGWLLDNNSFLSYWKDNIYDSNVYFPALLVNTAKTNGRRGVFCSVWYDDENLFLNADNLSQLDNGEAVSFYQGVSCTNRFPGFSPAAKIKNYGHYIDAGAIDNSGLLTSLDWYDNLKNGDNPVIKRETNVVFVEIINGLSNYVKYLLEKFKEEHPEITFVEFDEKEQGNLSAVISAGANLDKNPDYFSDLIKRLQERGRKPESQLTDSISRAINSKKYKVTHIPIYLPRIISIKNVESFIGGEIEDEKIRDSLEIFLEKENKKIYKYAETKSSKCSWETYEPTLARHLSKSTLLYYERVLNGDKGVSKNIDSIKKHLGLLK
ncbi:hypothetical protein [uncultured Kordia sp.]|uniref:hypothetical protein n=1 Tax=uncultured Kordia sp. TaxID=507699 RepID=UPI0026178077|nr:hypothetical protein [uncultured Kordia sp.]